MIALPATLNAALAEVSSVTSEMRRLMPNACGDWADKIDDALVILVGTFTCPICGDDKPHHHTPVVVDAYQNKRSRA